MRPFDIAVIGLLALAFAPAIVNMASVWATVDYFTHGFLVAPVALAVGLGCREALATLPARRDPRGGALVALGLAAHAAGLLTTGVTLQGVGLVLGVAGAVWLLRGPAWLRALAFPIAYLVFMIPLPPDWIAPLVSRLQLEVSEAAVAILHRAALPVAREGNVILVPDGSLFVAEACSGITSVITLLPVAVLLAWYTQKRWPGRLAVVAAVVPFAMLGNLSRVLFTVAAAVEVGAERATEGWLHQTAGLLTYGVACLALLAFDAVVRRLARPDATPRAA